MRNLKLKDVSEMVYRYSKENQVDLFTAYEYVDDVLKSANIFEFDTVKGYLFKHPELQKA